MLSATRTVDRIAAAAEIQSPDKRRVVLNIEARSRMTPKVATEVVRDLNGVEVDSPLVISSFISKATQAILRDGGVSYVDLAGNIRLVVSSPGLFIEVVGATVNPTKAERSDSLKGAKAGRVVRALIEQAEPKGVRELAAMAEVDAGYVSRLFTLLDAEALITRVGRGRLDSVAWPKLLQRWADDAPLSIRGKATSYIEPRGVPALLEKLRSTKRRYAITSSFAASRVAPIAPPRLLSVYTDDLRGLIEETGLRPTTAGANVQLIEPVDEDVFRATTNNDGLCYVALPIVVLDLLDGPGRAPAEAEALLEWMKKNEAVWRG